MTKDRLYTFSFNELFQIAQKEKIGVTPDIDKEGLVELVFDALEDERADREGNHSLTIRLAATKFAVSQDEEFFLDFENNTELPRRYKESLLVFMLRDPAWAFCYWDLEDRILAELLEQPEYSGLFLRIMKFPGNCWNKDDPVDWFDIPIQFSDMSRYINLSEEDRYYGVELHARIGEQSRVLVRSNVVCSSRTGKVRGSNDIVDTNCSHLIELSGLSSDVGKFPGTSYLETVSPQRIIGNGLGANNGR